MMKARTEILTLDEVAAYLKTSVKTVRRRIASGLLKSFKEGGRRMITGDALDDYVRNQIHRRGAR